ncbi:MAG: DUF2059 domain-containing protein [Kiloniellaceae bacterium]
MTIFKQLAAVVLVCAATLALNGPAAAQTSKAEKARELFQIFQADGIMEQMFDAAFTQMDALARQSNPELPNEARTIIQEEVKTALKESLPLLIEKVAVIYEQVFTEEELDGMLDFYRSPVGQSMIAKMPEMMGQSVQLSQQWAMGMLQSLPGRVEQRLKSEGYEL